MVVDTNEKLFDLLNEWSNTVLEPTSNVGDTKQYVNQLYEILPLFINQSIIFSDTILTKDSSWETLKPNTIHYFNALGSEGAPDSSMVKSQAGYLLYINSTVTNTGLQICVTEDLNVLFRVAPKGTWIMNATNLSVNQLNDKVNDFAKQLDEAGLNALQLRVGLLDGKVNNLLGNEFLAIGGTNLIAPAYWKSIDNVGYYDTGSGNIGGDDNDLHSDLIELDTNYSAITITTYEPSSNSSPAYVFFDKDKKYLTGSNLGQSVSYSVVNYPTNAVYLGISVPNPYKYGGKFKIEYGTKTTDWSLAPQDTITYWVGTEAEYDALGKYSDNTLYLIPVKQV